MHGRAAGDMIVNRTAWTAELQQWQDAATAAEGAGSRLAVRDSGVLNCRRC